MPLPIPPNVANNPQPICIIPHKNVLSVTCGLPRHLISYPGYPSLPVCRGRSGCVYGLSSSTGRYCFASGEELAVNRTIPINLIVATYAIGHGVLRPKCAVELTTA